MDKLLILFLLISTVFSSNKNVGFLMNQKYVCVNKGAFVGNKIIPLMSKEETLQHPIRIVIDEDNVLHTDGIIKDLKHIEKTMYGNKQFKIILVIEKNQRYIMTISQKMKNIPMIYQCVETQNWTILK